MKILIVSPLAPPVGGIATWTSNIISSFDDDSDFNIDVVNTAVTDRSLSGSSVLEKIFKGWRQAFRIFLNISSKLRFEKFDLVHISSAGEYGLARDILIILYLRIKKIPCVLHLHRGKVPDYPFLMKRYFSIEFWLTFISAHLASYLIVLNFPAKESFPRKIQEKISVVPNFVSSIKSNVIFDYSFGESVEILFVGYVIDRKGAANLVLACSGLVKKFNKIRLRFVGPVDPVYQKELEKAAILCSGGAEWISFSGSVGASDVNKYMLNADIFCLPSYAEGFPFVVLEAMNCGLPIISTNVGAIPWMLNEGAGICVDPGNVLSLENSIDLLITNEEIRSNFGVTAKERCARNFSDKAVSKIMKELWEKSCREI